MFFSTFTPYREWTRVRFPLPYLLMCWNKESAQSSSHPLRPGCPAYLYTHHLWWHGKLAFLLKTIGTEVPSHPHARRYGVTGKRAFFPHEAAKGAVMEFASVRIAPAQHANCLETAVRSDRVIDPSPFTVSRESGVEALVVSSPRHPVSTERGRHPDGFVFTQPAADRLMSGPTASATSRMPASLQRMAPRPPGMRSPLRMGLPNMRTLARQTVPRFHRMTCSVMNGCRPLSLTSPRMRNRTAEARGVPAAMACSS